MSLFNKGSSYVPQPYLAFVKFKLDGVEHPSIPPDNILSFSCETKQNALGKMTLSLFDRKFIPLESQIRQSGKNGFSVQWGYVQGVESAWFDCGISEIVPTYTSGGVTLEIQGTGKEAINSHDRFFPGTTSVETHGKTIGEIVKAIADFNGWKLDIEPPKSVMQHDSNKDTHETPITFLKKNNQTDWQFLLELADYARAERGSAGYVVFVDQNTKPYTLHFHPPKTRNTIKRSFQINCDKNTEVLSISPQVKLMMGLKMGQAGSNIVGLDPVTKEEFDVLKNHYNTPEKEISGDGALATDPATSARRREVQVVHSRALATTIANQEYYTQSKSTFVIDMDIQGDPSLNVGDRVDVYFYSMAFKDANDNYQNAYLAASGSYTIISVSHNISGGTYITKLNLNSREVFRGPKKPNTIINVSAAASWCTRRSRTTIMTSGSSYYTPSGSASAGAMYTASGCSAAYSSVYSSPARSGFGGGFAVSLGGGSGGYNFGLPLGASTTSASTSSETYFSTGGSSYSSSSVSTTESGGTSFAASISGGYKGLSGSLSFGSDGSMVTSTSALSFQAIGGGSGITFEGSYGDAAQVTAIMGPKLSDISVDIGASIAGANLSLGASLGIGVSGNFGGISGGYSSGSLALSGFGMSLGIGSSGFSFAGSFGRSSVNISLGGTSFSSMSSNTYSSYYSSSSYSSYSSSSSSTITSSEMYTSESFTSSYSNTFAFSSSYYGPSGGGTYSMAAVTAGRDAHVYAHSSSYIRRDGSYAIVRARI